MEACLTKEGTKKWQQTVQKALAECYAESNEFNKIDEVETVNWNDIFVSYILLTNFSSH